MEKIIFIASYSINLDALNGFLLKKLTSIKQENFGLVCNSNPDSCDVIVYSGDKNKIIIDRGCILFMNIVKSIVFDDLKGLHKELVNEERQKQLSSLLLVSGYTLSKFLVHRKLSVYEEVATSYANAVEKGLIDYSKASLDKFVLASMIWHEATHANNPIKSSLYHLSNVLWKILCPSISASIVISYTELFTLKHEFLPDLAGLFAFSYLLTSALGFISEYPATVAQNQYEEICELAKFVEDIEMA